jgi:hypothetical protein
MRSASSAMPVSGYMAGVTAVTPGHVGPNCTLNGRMVRSPLRAEDRSCSICDGLTAW